MPYIPAPFNYYGNEENQVLNDLERANNNFTILGQLCVNNDPTTGRVKDADKVDGFHASQNPAPNTIPVTDSSGKLHRDFIPTNIPIDNADKVDGYHASQTPNPNTIPVSRDNGRIDLNWIPQGSGSGLNADLLDGVNESQFVRTDVSRTITVPHTIDTISAPFVLSDNAKGKLVEGFNADLLDGLHEKDFWKNSNNLSLTRVGSNDYLPLDISGGGKDSSAHRLYVIEEEGRYVGFVFMTSDGVIWRPYFIRIESPVSQGFTIYTKEFRPSFLTSSDQYISGLLGHSKDFYIADIRSTSDSSYRRIAVVAHNGTMREESQTVVVDNLSSSYFSESGWNFKFASFVTDPYVSDQYLLFTHFTRNGGDVDHIKIKLYRVTVSTSNVNISQLREYNLNIVSMLRNPDNTKILQNQTVDPYYPSTIVPFVGSDNNLYLSVIFHFWITGGVTNSNNHLRLRIDSSYNFVELFDNPYTYSSIQQNPLNIVFPYKLNVAVDLSPFPTTDVVGHSGSSFLISKSTYFDLSYINTYEVPVSSTTNERTLAYETVFNNFSTNYRTNIIRVFSKIRSPFSTFVRHSSLVQVGNDNFYVLGNFVGINSSGTDLSSNFCVLRLDPDELRNNKIPRVLEITGVNFGTFRFPVIVANIDQATSSMNYEFYEFEDTNGNPSYFQYNRNFSIVKFSRLEDYITRSNKTTVLSTTNYARLIDAINQTISSYNLPSNYQISYNVNIVNGDYISVLITVFDSSTDSNPNGRVTVKFYMIPVSSIPTTNSINSFWMNDYVLTDVRYIVNLRVHYPSIVTNFVTSSKIYFFPRTNFINVVGSWHCRMFHVEYTTDTSQPSMNIGSLVYADSDVNYFSTSFTKDFFCAVTNNSRRSYYRSVLDYVQNPVGSTLEQKIVNSFTSRTNLTPVTIAQVSSAAGFNIYWSRTDVIFNGKQTFLENGSVDLKQLFPTNYRNNRFYLYLTYDSNNERAKLEFSTENTPSTTTRVNLGYVETSDTGISNVNVEKKLVLEEALSFSRTSVPSGIPVGNAFGKIDVNWLPPSVASLPYETYSRMYVGDEIPTNLQHGDLAYVRTQNSLYRYDKRTGQLIEVDWRTIIESSPEWKSGRLRVNSTTGKLEISPNGTNWYECIPAVGSQAIELATVDNTTFSYKYWIAPGQTVVIRNANHVPIVYAKDVVPFFSGSYFHSFAYEAWIGLRPSNVAISDGDGQWLAGSGTGVGANRSTSQSIVPILEQSNTSQNWANFELRILSSNRFLGNSVGQGFGGYEVMICNTSGTASATSYWLGTWFTQNGQQFTMNNLTLTRRS